MYITVLYGGRGTEREVSLASGLRVTKALSASKHRVHLLDFCGELEENMLPFLHQADAVFLALHGDAGEGGDLQAALNAAGIRHYTGSDAAGAALAMNKQRAKQAVKSVGVPVTADTVWQPSTPPPVCTYPCAVKPLCGGSSVGLCIASKKQDIDAICPTEPMLIEPLLPGREYTVGVLAGQALPVIEICPQGGVYDYRRKYTAGETAELCPAPISTEKARLLQKWAQTASDTLGLRDYARIDFKEDDNGIPHFLEANTLPGMTETSLFPLAAATAGIDFQALCTRMAELAAGRRTY